MNGDGSVNCDAGFAHNNGQQQLSQCDLSKKDTVTPHSLSSNTSLDSSGYKDRAVTQSTPILNTLGSHSPKDVRSNRKSDSARKAKARGARRWKSETSLSGMLECT